TINGSCTILGLGINILVSCLFLKHFNSPAKPVTKPRIERLESGFSTYSRNPLTPDTYADWDPNYYPVKNSYGTSYA
ncbi:unnamed protein product, partial [Rotaria magnacalcarata]